jgi:hypothetical protein
MTVRLYCLECDTVLGESARRTQGDPETVSVCQTCGQRVEAGRASARRPWAERTGRRLARIAGADVTLVPLGFGSVVAWTASVGPATCPVP